MDLSQAFDRGYQQGCEALARHVKEILDANRGWTYRQVLIRMLEFDFREGLARQDRADYSREKSGAQGQQRLWAAARGFRIASRELSDINEHLVGYVDIRVRALGKNLGKTIGINLVKIRSFPETFSETQSMESMESELRHEHGELEMNGDWECGACRFVQGFRNGQRDMLIHASMSTGRPSRGLIEAILKKLSRNRSPSVLNPGILAQFGESLMEFQQEKLERAYARHDESIKVLAQAYLNL